VLAVAVTSSGSEQAKENLMYANVVVGVDGLAGGRDAVALAEALAPAAVRLSLAHVRVRAEVLSRGSSGPFEIAEHELSGELLQRERSSCLSQAETVSAVATSVGAGLHDVAERRGADLIVVGSAHRSAVGRILAGDDARSALHHAPCAVAVAPSGYANGPRRIGTIAAAYDGSDESNVARAHAALLAARLGGQLVVRNVIELRVYGGGAWTSGAVVVPDPQTAVETARERLADMDGVEFDVTAGPVREELAALSERVDLLVCGSRHQGVVKRVVLGSTSDYLARHSACPLLVTPATDEQRVATWRELRSAAAA
jgi:nucleotide-binding universal stress UspA family protein